MMRCAFKISDEEVYEGGPSDLYQLKASVLTHIADHPASRRCIIHAVMGVFRVADGDPIVMDTLVRDIADARSIDDLVAQWGAEAFMDLADRLRWSTGAMESGVSIEGALTVRRQDA